MKNGKAECWRNGQIKSLGYFNDILEAAYARFAAEQCLGYQDCDINSSAKQYIYHYGAEVL